MSGGDWTVGFHAVESALRSGRPIETVWLQEGRRDGRMRALERLARSAGASIRRVSAQELAEISGGTPHNGCAARGAPVAWAPLEACIKPEGEAARLVLLDGVTDPHNLGAVIRSVQSQSC